MQIGLIGGIGPAATDYYYRRLISTFARDQVPLDLTIVHADTPTLLGNLENNDTSAQVSIYSRLTDRLVAAGAGCVVITSIAGHFCIKQFAPVSPLTVIDMIAAVDSAVCVRGLQRLGILGTRTVMETRFYDGITTADVLPPPGSLLDDVHAAYVAMAASGEVTDDQRAVFDKACDSFIARDQVDAILLGGTDLALVYDGDQTKFPIVDCAAIHVDAVVKAANENE